MQTFDFLVVGGGIAGASAAASLSTHGTVMQIERETQAGYHSTGRSAAVLLDSYGPPGIRMLTQASRPFFESPPDGFSEVSLLSPCAALWVAREDQLDDLEDYAVEVSGMGLGIERLNSHETRQCVPTLREDYVAGGLYEPDPANMDVNAIHRGFLGMAKQRGAKLLLNAELHQARRLNGTWQVRAGKETFACGAVVNAAGAWCDEVAAVAGASSIGLTPKRRTAVLLPAPAEFETSRWPLTIDISEEFIFKPDAGKLLASPCDVTPSPPCDAQPEEIDVAIIVDRLQKATTLSIPRIEHRWAGLRSFTSDGELAIGEDPEVPDFFWCAGQGGYGIQTAPAAGRAVAALLTDRALPEDLTKLGLSESLLAPSRLA